MDNVESAVTDLPPGCSTILANLVALRGKGRLPHALMLSGPRGVGKALVAEAFASILLNPQDQGEPSRIAALIEAGTHPDLIQITPETGKKVISIDQIRDLGERLSLTPHFGGLKVAVINPAESMTIQASNALLKTLEEPPGDTVILLLTPNKGRLAQTVKSRCQHVVFQRPSPSQSIRWLSQALGSDPDTYLSMAQGAPLLALDYHAEGFADSYNKLMTGLESLLLPGGDPLSLAADFVNTLAIQDLLSWVKSLVRALIREKMTAGIESNNPTKVLNHLKLSVDDIDLVKLFAYQDFLQQLEQEKDANLNRELFLEELFIRWSALASA